jgi:hypothetical protein
MTHVLLTRSPLSPGPKPWFSLDLHVLSAPPAFVLSQDQTLREETRCRPKPANLVSPLELELKVVLERVQDRREMLRPSKRRASFRRVRRSRTSRCRASRQRAESRRKRTLLSFQRPLPPAWPTTKSLRLAPEALRKTDSYRIRFAVEGAPVVECRDLSLPSLSGGREMIAAFGGLSSRGIQGDEPHETALSGLHDGPVK